MTELHTTEQSPENRGSRRIQAGLAAALVVVLAAFVLALRPGTGAGSTYTTDQSVTYQDFGGTIRNSGSGWYVIDDAGHTPDDITIGTVNSTSVRVNYPTCDEITSFIVAPDDTYAKDFGLTVGASVGFSYAVLMGQVNDGPDAGYLPDVWNPTTDYSGSSNLWVSGRCKVYP
jgi:hypothetical protein